MLGTTVSRSALRHVVSAGSQSNITSSIIEVMHALAIDEQKVQPSKALDEADESPFFQPNVRYGPDDAPDRARYCSRRSSSYGLLYSRKPDVESRKKSLHKAQKKRNDRLKEQQRQKKAELIEAKEKSRQETRSKTEERMTLSKAERKKLKVERQGVTVDEVSKRKKKKKS